MNVKELIKELQKMPQNMSVKVAVANGRGQRTITDADKIEVLYDAWVTLSAHE